jgi:uncharacterized caspase-like protein
MAASRQAMVIGNSAYPRVFALDNPARDAGAMVTALAEIGIEVTLAIDILYDQLLDRIDEFISRANLSTTNASILYYSGHGLQLKNINYMVPIDFRGLPGGELCRLVSVQSVVDRMTSATALRVVLLDACRTGGEAVSIIGGRAVDVNKRRTLTPLRA